MEKYHSSKHGHLQTHLPFSYTATPIYLDHDAYTFERNGESLVVWQDTEYVHEFPCMYLPQKKENWPRCSVTFATKDDIQALENAGIKITMQHQVATEYYYATDDFLHPKGNMKNRMQQFLSSYDSKVLHTYKKEDIEKFYDSWKLQRPRSGKIFESSERFFAFCLTHLDTYEIQQVYVEVDAKLIGLAWGVRFPHTNNWVGLHLKADYSYKGLSRFLHHERAKLFQGCEEFSLGTGVDEEGIEQYKHELGPKYTKDYSYVLSGDAKVPTS